MNWVFATGVAALVTSLVGLVHCIENNDPAVPVGHYRYCVYVGTNYRVQCEFARPGDEGTTELVNCTGNVKKVYNASNYYECQDPKPID